MNKSFLALGAVVLVLVGGMVGYAFAPKLLGTSTVTPSNALNQARLVTEFTVVAAPLQNIGNATTAAIDFTNLTNASGTVTQSTTTVVTNLAASLGDLVLLQPNTPTTGATFIGQVTTASTTSATVTITEIANASGMVDATSTTFAVVTLPFSSFKAVTGL